MKKSIHTSLALSSALFMASAACAAGVDEEAAEALMKKSDCTKCHGLEAKKDKDGRPYKETAAKYKKEGGGEQKLFTHLTTGPMVKVDGKEEKHINLKSKNEDDIRNVIGWILSR